MSGLLEKNLEALGKLNPVLLQDTLLGRQVRYRHRLRRHRSPTPDIAEPVQDCGPRFHRIDVARDDQGIPARPAAEAGPQRDG